MAKQRYKIAQAAEIPAGKATAVNAKRLYLRGVIMNVTNPKVAVFFLAFLPQFADPSRGPVAVQVLSLGAIFIAATLLVFSSVAWGAGYLGERLGRSRKAQVLLNRIAGTVFIGLALRLAFTQR